MNDHMKLSEILMDELPEEHPWKGNIKGLVERLIANGVTFAKDTDVLTNADRIRAMSDEELAAQLVQVFKERIKVLTDMDMPEELLDEFWNSFLERLKQPAGDQQHKHFPNGDCK